MLSLAVLLTDFKETWDLYVSYPIAWKRCWKEKPEVVLKCCRWTPFRASSFIPSSIRRDLGPTDDAVFVWLLTSRDGYMVIWWYAWLHVSLIQSDGIIWDTKSKDSVWNFTRPGHIHTLFLFNPALFTNSEVLGTNPAYALKVFWGKGIEPTPDSNSRVLEAPIYL